MYVFQHATLTPMVEYSYHPHALSFIPSHHLKRHLFILGWKCPDIILSCQTIAALDYDPDAEKLLRSSAIDLEITEIHNNLKNFNYIKSRN